jgi:hypothetical protein
MKNLPPGQRPEYLQNCISPSRGLFYSKLDEPAKNRYAFRKPGNFCPLLAGNFAQTAKGYFYNNTAGEKPWKKNHSG